MRKHSPKLPPLERQCETCNKSFKIWASLVVRHGKAGRWCSRECFLVSCRVEVTCDKCGIKFERQKKTASRYSGKNYCSRECNHLGRRTNPDRIAVKRLRYGSTEFRRARKLITERDGVCQICSDGLANSIHHKDWNPLNNHLDNLVLLCRSCHARFKRYEDWETGSRRIMACSELTGNSKSVTEMLTPSLQASNNTETRLEICV